MHITQIQDLEGFISLGTLSFGNSKSVIILLSRRIPLSFGHQQYAWYHDFGGTDSMFTLCADGRLSLLPVKLDFRDNQRGGYSRLFIISTCTLKIFPHLYA